MNKLFNRTAVAAATIAATVVSASAFANDKGASGKETPQKSVVEQIKQHPDAGVATRILIEAGRAAAGVGSAVGAGVGVLLTPSKIGCGQGEHCR